MKTDPYYLNVNYNSHFISYIGREISLCGRKGRNLCNKKVMKT